MHAVSRWIDQMPGNQARDNEAQTWGRVAKIAEESGEVVAALIGALGHNPRKGQTGSLHDVERELLDVAMTALCAVAHLHGNDPEHADLMQFLADHVEKVAARAGIGT
jgi:NTP pyrophosphatase (non-canonical NTP hydrolase)